MLSEIDRNCPYLILLECIESKLIKEAKDISRLKWIDQHFLCYSHFTDFGLNDDRKRQNLIQRTRAILYSQGPNMVFWT